MDHRLLVIQVCTGLLTTQSFESGVLQQGNSEDKQDSGPPGLEFETPALVDNSLLNISSQLTICLFVLDCIQLL